MNIPQYFVPQHTAAKVVIVGMVFAFLLWLFFVVRGIFVLGRRKREIESFNQHLPELVRMQNEIVEAKITSFQEISSRFRAFVESLGISSASAISRHLESIFRSGCTETRLDSGELLRHTERQIARGESSLRSVMSLFIIAGLLGTLFGISDSVGSVLDVLQGTQHQGELQGSLRQMLQSLQGAFAPSLWGVLLTIVSVLIYMWRQPSVVMTVARSLRESTLALWIPELQPTFGQRAAQAAQQSVEAASSVAQFAQEIRDDTSDFKQAIHDSKTLAEACNEALAGLRQAVNESANLVSGSLSSLALQIQQFNTATAEFSSHEVEIRDLFSQTLANGVAQLKVHEDVRLALAEFDKSNRGAVQELERSVSGISAALSSFSKPLSDAAGRIEQLMKASGEAMRVIALDFAGTITAPFEKLEKHVTEQTEALKSSLAHLSRPFENAATELSQQATLSIKTQEDVIRTAQKVFNDQLSASRELASALQKISLGLEARDAAAQNERTELRGTLTGLSQLLKQLSANLAARKESEERLAAVLAKLDLPGRRKRWWPLGR